MLDLADIHPAPPMYDDRYQYLTSRTVPHVFNQYILYGSWSLELACALITLGRDDPERIPERIAETINLPEDSRMKLFAQVTRYVYSRAVDIANSYVAIGLMKDPDTPANWIAWAKSKGYSVAHLLPAGSTAPAAKVEAAKSSDWKEQARAIADECFDHDTKMDCRDCLIRKRNGKPSGGYAYRVMKLMQERGITGPRGSIGNASTVMRDALQGDLWWANKGK